jgi:hypothetical protein
VTGPPYSLAMDRASKRLLTAWICSDVIWVVLFIRAVKRSERVESLADPRG